MKIRNWDDWMEEDDIPRRDKKKKKPIKKPRYNDEWGIPQKDAKKSKRNRRVKTEE